MELVTDPKLLFLDEPTTGLDAYTALEVIRVCKRLSEKTTIIMSIHQPRGSIWSLYDWVVIVDKPGTVIYQGGPDSLIERLEMIGYPCDEYSALENCWIIVKSICRKTDEKHPFWSKPTKLISTHCMKTHLTT